MMTDRGTALQPKSPALRTAEDQGLRLVHVAAPAGRPFAASADHGRVGRLLR